MASQKQRKFRKKRSNGRRPGTDKNNRREINPAKSLS